MEQAVKRRFTAEKDGSVEVVLPDHKDVEDFILHEMAPEGVFAPFGEGVTQLIKRGVRRRIKAMVDGRNEAAGSLGRITIT